MSELLYEKQIIDAAKTNPERFGELYDKHVEKVYRYIYRRVSDRQTAEDLTSITFTKAIKNLPGYKWNGNPFVCWLYRIARNNLIDWYRKQNRTKVVSIDDQYNSPALRTDATQKDQLSQKEVQEEITRALELLDESDREIITLKYFEELSNKEIAQVMNLSANHVGVKLFRALKKLRTSLTHCL